MVLKIVGMDYQMNILKNLKWPIEDLLLLYSRIEAHLPGDDVLMYKSREAKLPWDKILFGGYMAEDCFNAWKMARQQVRSFRLLSEMVNDARVMTQKILKNEDPVKIYDTKPKLPLNAYSAFVIEFMKNHPEIPNREKFKMAAEAYHKLPGVEKQKFENIAAEDRIRYKKEILGYKSKYPELYVSAVESKNSKKLLSAYNLFFEEQRYHPAIAQEYENKRKELRKYCMKLWKNMGDSEKLVWVEKAYSLQQEMEQTTDNLPKNFMFVRNKDVLTKKQKELRDRALGKPDPPPASTYELFLKKMFKTKEVMALSNKDRMKRVSEMWKLLTEDQKFVYEKKLKHLKEEYRQQYAEFINSLDPKVREDFLASRSKYLVSSGLKGRKKIKEIKTIERLQFMTKMEEGIEDIAGPSEETANLDETVESSEMIKKKKRRATSERSEKTDILESEGYAIPFQPVEQGGKTKKKKKKNRTTSEADTAVEENEVLESEENAIPFQAVEQGGKTKKKKKKNRTTSEAGTAVEENEVLESEENVIPFQPMEQGGKTKKKKKKNRTTSEADTVIEENGVLESEDNAIPFQPVEQGGKTKKKKKKEQDY